MRKYLTASIAVIAMAFVAGNLTVTKAAISTPDHYTVEAGETYRSIAAKFGLSETALACANRTNATSCPGVTVQPGTGRIIHLTDVPAPTTTTIAATITAVTTTAAPTTTMDMSTTTAAGPPTTQAPPAGALYVNDFASPTDVHDKLLIQEEPPGNQLAQGGFQFMPFMGDHDMNCGTPFTYRQLTENGGVGGAADDVVWYCNPAGTAVSGHMMTGMETGGYRTIAFTPTAGNGAIIFPATANQICFDLSHAALGGRKWPEVAVISDNRYQANGGRLVYQNPVFVANSAPNSVQMAGDDFMFFGIGIQYFVGQNATYQDFFTSNPDSMTDKATRLRNCLRDNGNGTVTHTAVRFDGTVATSTGPGAFPAGPRVFIILDVTYDADKEQPAGSRVEQPYTWHWDNITIG